MRVRTSQGRRRPIGTTSGCSIRRSSARGRLSDLDAPVPAAADDELVGRMRAFMRKAIKEAKRHTSWLYENPDYERAVDEFVQRSLDGPTARRFLSSFVPFARRLSWFGMFGSLAQMVLRLGGPGVPDIYQGSELWNLDLVDPDNRRRVDFARRCQLLTTLEPILTRPDAAMLSPLLDEWADGRVKLYTMAAALRRRKALKDTFLRGAYLPLAASGDAEEHVVAFARQDADRDVIVAAPRFVATLVRGSPRLPLGIEAWGSATLTLPRRLAGGASQRVHGRAEPAGGGGRRPGRTAAGAPLQRVARGNACRVSSVVTRCPASCLAGKQAQ